MMDMMLEATAVLMDAWGDELNIYASPWSPPVWMKAPTPWDKAGAEHAAGMMNSAQPTCLRDGVGPDSQYAKAWALYFSKFLTAYADKGLTLFAVTIQNEPEFPAPWEACSYTEFTQSDFLLNHLGPELRASHPNVKIFIFDHNKDHAPRWVKHLMNETNPARQYVDGTAIHWYAGGMDRLLDGAQGSPNLHKVLQDLDHLGAKNDHIVFGSEACHCPTTGYAGGDIGVAWARAERYAHSILADLAGGSNGWVEWNLILDSIGGPNHFGNLCDATLLAVPHRAVGVPEGTSPIQSFETHGHPSPFGRVVGDGRTREELNALGFAAKYLDVGVVVQPLYYYMGHISRHVRPGSVAVKALVDSSAQDRIFRRAGQVVAGGGTNDLARVGIELTVWPCEGSTRQQIKFNKETQLQVFGHDWLGMPTESCVSKKVNTDFEGLMLGSCDIVIEEAGEFELAPFNETMGTVRFLLKNGYNSSCIVVKELQNQGGAYGYRGGSQVALGDCDSPAAEWTVEEGEIISSYLGDDVCMTTGWPFLQMGAFETAGNDNAIVILNEANEAANYVLKDGMSVILAGSIPAHSIQTVTLT
jgi:glucosylceramidase